MGASVNVPRQRNSTYVQTVRWYIYETRWPKHPHLSISWYERRPPGTSFTDLLHQILTKMDISTSTSMSKSTVSGSLTPLLLPRACCRVKILCIGTSYPPSEAPSSASDISNNSTVPTRFDSRFLTVSDLVFTESIRPKVFDWI